MYAEFKIEKIPLKKILLDERNPRIVTQQKISSQPKILEYFFEHEDLSLFINKISKEGKNHGAELPYVIKNGSNYIVIEGNTRIAAYKVLTGLLNPPAEFNTVPKLDKQILESLLTVNCNIAPDRDSLLPIVANSHFGLGDKSKWSFLGSRKAVFDEYIGGKSLEMLAKAFSRKKSEIIDLILEYKFYLLVIGYAWTKQEKAELLRPAVEFNPPIRFLESSGHKELVGIEFDKVNVEIKLHGMDAEQKICHLVNKLVIHPQRKLGATASYEQVFADFVPAASKRPKIKAPDNKKPSAGDAMGAGQLTKEHNHPVISPKANTPKGNSLLNYQATKNSSLLQGLMKEAQEINIIKLPAASTFLLRNVVEALLRHIIHEQSANLSQGKLDLETCLNTCKSKTVILSSEDKQILKEFSSHHLNYLNLGAHGNVVPNVERLKAARDCIDEFIRRNI